MQIIQLHRRDAFICL